MAAKCEGNEIKILDRVYLPHSLGFFYTALCQLIGFGNYGEEYKVMGLAPYGEDNYANLMKSLVGKEKNSWFKLNTPYFGMHEGGESGAIDRRGRIIMGRLYTNLLVDQLVVFADHVSALGVAHDGEPAADVFEHTGGYFSGEGALILIINVLCTQQYFRAGQRLGNRYQVNKWRTGSHLYICSIYPPGQRPGQLHSSLTIQVHLPVARHKRFTHLPPRDVLRKTRKQADDQPSGRKDEALRPSDRI